MTASKDSEATRGAASERAEREHSSERCGYRLNLGVTHDEFPDEQCDRSVWEDRDRCVWHARVERKTPEVFEDTDPEGDLDGAYLRGASLVGVDWLAGRSLVGADLRDAEIMGVDFTDANLMLASMGGASAINTDFRGANLEGVNFTNADLRRARLEGARLHETVLTDVHIGGGTNVGETTVYDRESVSPELTDAHPLAAAAWVYRQLQELYQDNALPQLARRSYVKEKDTRRQLAWEQFDVGEALKWELSRWVMRYGESPYRVLLTSLVVIVLAAVLFPLTGGIKEVNDGNNITYTIDNPESAPQWWIVHVLFKSLYFSVITFATLGYGDIQPIGTEARFLAGAESILGALLAALLVFVLARIVTW